MNILLVNDDGIKAQGLHILAETLSVDHSIYIVAPDSERSAASHSYSFSKPLKIDEYEDESLSFCKKVLTTNGSPCDCVLLGIEKLGRDNIDMVIAGINAGANLGTDIPASATVGAALEGTIQGIPSLAVSQEITKLMSKDDFSRYYRFAAEFTKKLIESSDTERYREYILSINFPLRESKEIKGFKVCPMGKSMNNFFYSPIDDFFGRTYYYVNFTRTKKDYNEINGTDAKWLDEGYITVTPMSIDMTLYSKFGEVNELLSGVNK